MRFRGECIIRQNNVVNHLGFTYCCILILLPAWGAIAKIAFFKENLYVNLGFGGFQCDRFKEDGIYIKNRPKTAYLFTVGGGYKFSQYLRSDINLQYSRFNYKASDRGSVLNQKIRIITGMLNLSCRIYPKYRISPYISAGFGVSSNQAMQLSGTYSVLKSKGRTKMNLAWNIGAGMELDTVSRNYLVDVGYKYVDLGKIYTRNFAIRDKDLTQNIKGHQVVISIVFKF